MTEENTNTITISKSKMWKYSAFMFGLLFIGTLFFQGGSSTGNVIVFGGEPGEIVEIKTTLQGSQYNPDTITVKKGSKVILVIDNKDSLDHGLHLPQFGVSRALKPNAINRVEFTAVNSQADGQVVPTCSQSQEHGETLTFNVV